VSAVGQIEHGSPRRAALVMDQVVSIGFGSPAAVDGRNAQIAVVLRRLGERLLDKEKGRDNAAFPVHLNWRVYAAAATLLRERKPAKARPAKPRPIIAQVDASGTVLPTATEIPPSSAPPRRFS
jgi:hypothetical protein